MIKLYNARSRSIESFSSLKKNEVTMYSCGSTVYSYYHIGNLRNAIFNDTLRRTLESFGYKVSHAVNITDIGHLSSDADEGHDKLEEAAKTSGKKVTDIAEHYTDAFKRDMHRMNVLEPNAYHSSKYNDHYARATEFIDQQIQIITTLIEKNFAYITKEAIYFDVNKLKHYNELNPQDLSEKTIGSREEIVKDTAKKSPYDFAVWFFTVGRFENHTMKWQSPWGDGFPGWHLECSAIIHAVLGDPIDIHTGGVDHIGTHHPNEIAQTRAAFDNQLANYWVHNEFILVDGQKMSKSKNNTYTLADIQAKHYSPLDYRMLVLQAHYRTELNFSWDNLHAAARRLLKWKNIAALRFQPVNESSASINVDTVIESIKKALYDDLDTPKALRIIDESFDLIANGIPATFLEKMSEFLRFIDSVLALDLINTANATDEIKSLINQRQQARTNNNWEEADKIRQQLLNEGYELLDVPNGTIWQRAR